MKTAWFKTYTAKDRPENLELIIQSWDTANKPTELSDYSVCSTWGLIEKRIYLLDVLRKRLEYPDLKRLVLSHALLFGAQTVLIEDKASGTQLIQDLKDEGFYGAKACSVTLDKVMRLRSVTGIIESGFVHLPDNAHWLPEYLHEMATFPNGRFDDQVDSTSHALDWLRGRSRNRYGLLEWAKKEASSETPDSQYADLFTRPRGAAR